MIDSKENNKFDVGVKGLSYRIKCTPSQSPAEKPIWLLKKKKKLVIMSHIGITDIG